MRPSKEGALRYGRRDAVAPNAHPSGTEGVDACAHNDTAKVVFEEQGYGAASIGRITSQAGINRATFYLHFPDRSGVFRQVVAHERLHTDEYWRELNVALKERTPAAIAQWVQNLTTWARYNAELMPAKHGAMAADPEFANDFQPRYDRLATEIADYLDTFPGPASTREDPRPDARGARRPDALPLTRAGRVDGVDRPAARCAHRHLLPGSTSAVTDGGHPFAQDSVMNRVVFEA
jgi:AcrR family transcriptional regulator